MLRYVQLSPISASLSLEASLGCDLKQLQSAIVAAKVKLVSLSTSTQASRARGDCLQEVFEDALDYCSEADDAFGGGHHLPAH